MRDLIDRRAAIDLIERMKPCHQDADDIAEMIANMPAAQPNLQSTCNKLATDTISRAVAIEHLKKRLYETEFNSTTEYPYYQEIADNRVDVWMNEVPSAQSERKTGKWLPDTRTFEMMFVCSECKASLHVDTINLKPSWDYCPNCGSYNGGAEDG